MTHGVTISGKRLTVRQAEVFLLVGSGSSYVQAAAKLGIGVATVITYAKQVHLLLKGYEQMPPKAAIRHFWMVSRPGYGA